MIILRIDKLVMEYSGTSYGRVDKATALQKAEHFCAYQERSQQEVRDKLYSYGLAASDVEEVIGTLIESDFLNEKRFAFAYATGKFRQKGWGRIKIKQGLKFKKVSAPLIEKAIWQLDDEEYIEKLKVLLQKKAAMLAEKDPYRRKHKLISYALTRGYENDLILSVLNSSGLL